MILTRSSQYALELILYIVSRDSERYIPLNEAAEDLELSFHFLGKVAQILAQKGIIKSYRGPHGGFALSKPSNKVSQYDIIEAIEGEKFFTQCMLRPGLCDDDKPCPIHDSWSSIREDLENGLKAQTMDKYEDLKESSLLKEPAL